MTSSNHYDAIIIGAGHNGLAAGAYLARAGWRTLILERRPIIGGLAATEELVPGFRFDTGFPAAPLLRPEVVAELDLPRHGLEWVQPEVHLFAPAQGGGITLWADAEKTAASLAQVSPRDAARFPAFMGFVRRVSGVIQAMMSLTPPEIKAAPSLRELLPWARLALRVRGLGEREMMAFLRVLPMSVHTFLAEWFEAPALRGALGVFGTVGAMLGPLGAGTALNFLYHFGAGGAPGWVRGGAGQLAAALAGAAKAFGAEIQAGVPVRSILIENGRATGVETASGERAHARVVVSSADPRHTFFDLLGARHLPVRVVRRVQNIRFRGSTATVHLALRGLPDFGVDPARLRGWVVLCPGLMHLERAYDDAKYGRFSSNPALLVSIPSLREAGRAAEGQHTLSAMVRYAPYCLREGDWETQRPRLEQAVIDTLSAYAPDLPGLVLAARSFTPLDYAREFGLSEGSWMHGQMGLDQLLFMRPIPGWGRYRTPVAGLYLCGSGTHPGGGLTAAPGRNAARVILEVEG